MPVEIKWIECFIGLKVFILEFNGERDIHKDSYNAFYLTNK